MILILTIIIILGLVLYIGYDKEIIFSDKANEEKEEDDLNTLENNINTTYNQKKCYGTYYGESSATQDNGISLDIKTTFVLNPDGTYGADYGTSFEEGIYVTIGNTIVFIGPKHTFGLEDQDLHYYPESYVIADDCSYFKASNQEELIFRKQ